MIWMPKLNPSQTVTSSAKPAATMTIMTSVPMTYPTMVRLKSFHFKEFKLCVTRIILSVHLDPTYARFTV